MTNTKDIFTINSEEDFNAAALQIFKHQFKTNLVYHEFCNHLRKDLSNVSQIQDIPFIPIDFFKSKTILSGKEKAETIFTSSGTTGSITSKHYVTDTELYEESYLKAFEHFYGSVKEYCVLALLPSYLERKGSSLIYMVDDLIKKSEHPKSGFFLNNTDALLETLKTLQDSNTKTLLIGVSFGGMLVQEMARHIKTRKVLVVSSVKHESELPKRMMFAKYTKIHKLLPTGLVNNVELLAKYAFGDTTSKRLELYEEYLSIRDKYYLDWAIDQIVNWKSAYVPDALVHIHGEKDSVFPIGNIKNCIPVKNGTHTMIIHRAKWFNENLPTIILE